MTSTDTRFMYPCAWTEDYQKRSSQNYHMSERPTIREVDRPLILPAKESMEHTWGIGGALDESGELIPECTRKSFGGKYKVSESDIEYLDETVYYIPVIPKQWGHFLIDILCRLWFLGTDKDAGYRIAFCSKDFFDGYLSGNYREALQSLGIGKDRMLLIDRPMMFNRILIPSKTFGDGAPYSDEYLKLIEKIKANALQMITGELKAISKIYFTRTGFPRAKLKEIGEKEIEDAFRYNGFTVLSPEKLSLAEQIFYISNCEELASMSGTIPHNILFAEAGTKVTILNRTCFPNYAQFAINQMSAAEVIQVDCYSAWTLKHVHDFASLMENPILVGVNQNVRNYFKDRGFALPVQTVGKRLTVFAGNSFAFNKARLRILLKRSKKITSIARTLKSRMIL